MGLSEAELIDIAKMSFEHAFINENDKVGFQRAGKPTSAST
jgi:hypothetical protein